MLNLGFINLINPILIQLFINQILITIIMGKYSKEFRSMKNRSNCVLKSFLIVLFVISIVHMSESYVDDVTENTVIETENLQSSEEKTEEPVKAMNQIAYFQGTEKSIVQQKSDEIVPASLSELNSNSLLSFIPDIHSAASDDDDNEQNDAQESYLIAGANGNAKVLNQDDSMIKLLRGNRMLKEQLQSNDKELLKDDMKTLANDDSMMRNKKMYLIDHLSEIERIQGYLPSLMKLKRLVKKCQCSYHDEDQYSSIKDAMMPNRIDHRINLDYVDDDSEEDDDERDDDDEPQMNNVLKQRGFNKYKRFDLNNNFRDDDEDFERIRYNEFKTVEEDKSQEENELEGSSLDDFEEDSSSEEKSLDEDEYEEIEDENSMKDQNDSETNDSELGNQDLNANISGDKENEKLLSPFMTNLSPTSSSDIIFNELSMQTNQLDPNQLENEIQLAKLKRIISDGSLNTNYSNEAVKSNDLKSNDVTNPLAEGSPSSLSSLATQYSLASNNSPGNRGGGQRGGNKGGNVRKNDNKRNLLDHLILIRKRRQANKSSKGQLETKKGNSGGKSGGSNRN